MKRDENHNYERLSAVDETYAAEVTCLQNATAGVRVLSALVEFPVPHNGGQVAGSHVVQSIAQPSIESQSASVTDLAETRLQRASREAQEHAMPTQEYTTYDPFAS